MSKPFRWNIAHREQLGDLVHGELPETYDDFLVDIRSGAAKILARSGNAALVFVGRSPDNFFDYLSGALSHTSWADRLSLLNLSLRSSIHLRAIRKHYPTKARALHAHLAELRLDPRSLSRRGAVAFVDLVSGGSTFRGLAYALLGWAHEVGVDPRAVARNVRFVGITSRTKTSPNTFRWQQHAPWLRNFPSGAVKNVSIPAHLWRYLGDYQEKTTRSNTPALWGSHETQVPPRRKGNLRALRLALTLYDTGTSRDERLSLASEVAGLPEMRQPWLRKLVAELRRTSPARRRPVS